MITFSEFLKEAEDPVAQWLAMRQDAGWGDREQRVFSAADLGIPNVVWDQMRSGWQLGSVVPSSLVRLLDLNGSNASLVADSTLTGGLRSYPFVKDKRAGQFTGQIRFSRDYNPNDFLSIYSDIKK